MNIQQATRFSGFYLQRPPSFIPCESTPFYTPKTGEKVATLYGVNDQYGQGANSLQSFNSTASMNFDYTGPPIAYFREARPIRDLTRQVQTALDELKRSEANDPYKNINALKAKIGIR